GIAAGVLHPDKLDLIRRDAGLSELLFDCAPGARIKIRPVRGRLAALRAIDQHEAGAFAGVTAGQRHETVAPFGGGVRHPDGEQNDAPVVGVLLAGRIERADLPGDLKTGSEMGWRPIIRAIGIKTARRVLVEPSAQVTYRPDSEIADRTISSQ